MKKKVAGMSAVAVLLLSIATFSTARQSVPVSETASPAQSSGSSSGRGGGGGGKGGKQRAVCSHSSHGSDGWASECQPSKQARTSAEDHKKSHPDHHATVATCED